MPHLVLLGDSIFDNAAYVAGGPAVADHVAQLLPPDWTSTLLAQDGAVAGDVVRQLRALPGGATHLVVSAGGNDALGHAGLVRHGGAASYAEVLTKLGEIRRDFRASYRAMVAAASATGLPLAVCTIYDSIPGLGPADQGALCVFNDVITREAVAAGAGVIDLRLVCDEPGDYAASSPIEPSVAGGAKIARVIVSAVVEGRRGSWLADYRRAARIGLRLGAGLPSARVYVPSMAVPIVWK